MGNMSSGRLIMDAIFAALRGAIANVCSCAVRLKRKPIGTKSTIGIVSPNNLKAWRRKTSGYSCLPVGSVERAYFMWRRSLCGLARSSGGISAFRPVLRHIIWCDAMGGIFCFPFLPGGSTMFDQLYRASFYISRGIAKAPCWKSDVPT